MGCGGSVVEGGEDIDAAAVREVKEETGVDAEVVSLVAVREAHGRSSGAQGATNLFFVFLMRPALAVRAAAALGASEKAAARCLFG